MLSSPQFPASTPTNPEDHSGLITQCLNGVRQRLTEAALRHGRKPEDVRLLAVSKQQSAAAIVAAAKSGQLDFGESYLQEALPKMAECESLLQSSGLPKLSWHFIGQVQSNKTKPIAEHFDWLHTLDRDKIAQRLNDQRPISAKPLQVCIQVKLAEEETKGGIHTDEVLELAKFVVTLPRLTLRGLMCIPPPSQSTEQQRHYFARLAGLQKELNRQLASTGLQLDTLSMGMSGDYEAAIAEGATVVRIGTAIFGERT
ncbi:MAG TPA: YggS family pyridoxal phosphate-dependent enzyme [Steroidobacteraceae bacterium]|nr:YggS family pyridoxal phosphate-dependent enzyme [Steroidobacteraceae bacterium]